MYNAIIFKCIYENSYLCMYLFKKDRNSNENNLKSHQNINHAITYNNIIKKNIKKIALYFFSTYYFIVIL